MDDSWERGSNLTQSQQHRRSTVAILMLTFTVSALILLPLSQGLLLRQRLIRVGEELRTLWAVKAEDSATVLPVVYALRSDIESLDDQVQFLRRTMGPPTDAMAHQTWWPWLSRLGTAANAACWAASELSATARETAVGVESAIDEDTQAGTGAELSAAAAQDPFQAALEALGRPRPGLLRARQSALQMNQALLSRGGRVTTWSGYASLLPLATATA